MSCRDFIEKLAQGQPLTGSAADHLRSCESCRKMSDSFNISDESPDTRRVGEIREQIARTVKSVRPLPSDRGMFVIGLIVFCALSMLLAMPVGYQGFFRLNNFQRIGYYSTIAIAAVFFALATVQEIVPGSRRRVGSLGLFAILALVLLTPIGLFHNIELAEFVRHGIPCLRFGLTCAGISAASGFWLIAKGYACSPRRLALLFGLFAGLVGVAALALHCPIQNAAHIVVWHCGAMAISGFVAASIGALGHRSRNQ